MAASAAAAAGGCSSVAEYSPERVKYTRSRLHRVPLQRTPA